MAKILVVEDDELFRKTICDLLKKKSHDVFEAPNGKVATEILSMQQLDLVVSDIQMPEMDGIELLKWSLKKNPTPFIIMTGFSALLETQSAYDLGAKEFIAKPFKNADLFLAINKILKPEETMKVVEGINEFCKVSINDFVTGKKPDFDVYVKLSETKYVKIAYKGEELLHERIVHYKEKGVNHLYITKEGFNELVGFNLKVADLIHKKKDISTEKKLNFLKYTGEVILAKAFVSGVDKETFNESQTFLNLTIETISKSKQCFDLLELLNNHSDHLYAHSVAVALYSHMIAHKMGFVSNQALFKVSMAAMFHDIGKKEIETSILEKHRSLLSVEEKKILDSHVVRGQEILLSINGIPEDIAQMAYEHHEDFGGLGYPRGTDKDEHHPLSKILQLANMFIDIAMPGVHHQGMTGAEAVFHMETRYAGRFDPVAMKTLKSLFQK